jgi:hypothetical protein
LGDDGQQSAREAILHRAQPRLYQLGPNLSDAVAGVVARAVARWIVTAECYPKELTIDWPTLA